MNSFDQAWDFELCCEMDNAAFDQLDYFFKELNNE